MKKLKQIGCILLISVCMILVSYSASEAANEEGLTTSQIANWVRNESEEFFNLDAPTLLGRYYTTTKTKTTCFQKGEKLLALYTCFFALLLLALSIT